MENAEKRLEQKRVAILLQLIRQEVCEYRSTNLLKAENESFAKDEGGFLFFINREFQKLIAYLEGKKVEKLISMNDIRDELSDVQVAYREKFQKSLDAAEDSHDLEFAFDDYQSFITDCKKIEEIFPELRKEIAKKGLELTSKKTA